MMVDKASGGTGLKYPMVSDSVMFHWSVRRCSTFPIPRVPTVRVCVCLCLHLLELTVFSICVVSDFWTCEWNC